MNAPDNRFGVYRKLPKQKFYRLVLVTLTRERAHKTVDEFEAEGKVGGWYVTEYHGKDRL